MAAIGRHALFGTAVAAAFGLPYAFSDRVPTVKSAAQSHSTEASATALDAVTKDLPALRDPALPVEGPAVADLGEVLRFDITPAWLTSRWPRVMNTRHQAGGLQSYRVPLVTGHKETDLAGSLTYYFDATQQLERIEFSGRTGNAHTLVDFLSQRYGFSRRKSADPGSIEYGSRDGKAGSELILRSSPVLDASMPQSRFLVQLALSRPPSEHRMFSEAPSYRFDSRRWP